MVLLRKHLTGQSPLAIAVVAVDRCDRARGAARCLLEASADERYARVKTAMGTDGDDWRRAVLRMRFAIRRCKGVKVFRDSGCGARVAYRITTGREWFVQQERQTAINGPQRIADMRHRLRGDDHGIDGGFSADGVKPASGELGQRALEGGDLENGGVWIPGGRKGLFCRLAMSLKFNSCCNDDRVTGGARG